MQFQVIFIATTSLAVMKGNVDTRKAAAQPAE
jgi:hypothetical protein